jgi:exopolyphosphatase/pppGpp-phosphohydrolase
MCAEIAERLQAGCPPQSIRAAGVDRVVGTAGTATTLAALDLDLPVYDPARVHRATCFLARMSSDCWRGSPR